MAEQWNMRRMSANNRPIGVLRVETIGFSKLDNNKIISDVIEVQPVREVETKVEGDRETSIENDSYKPVITVTKNEAILTKPGYQLHKITVKETDGSPKKPSENEKLRTEVITYFDPNEDGRQIDSAAPSGPHSQRKDLEPIDKNNEYKNPIRTEKCIENDKSLVIVTNENYNQAEPKSSEFRENPREDNIPVQKPEIELTEKEAIYNKPVSRLPKRIVAKVEELPVNNAPKEPKTNKNIRIETSEIVDAKFIKKEGRSTIHSMVPDTNHIIRQDDSYHNKPGISKSLATTESEEKAEDIQKNIDVRVFDNYDVSSDVPFSPHKIRVQHEFNFETEKNMPNEIRLANGALEQSDDTQQNDKTVAVIDKAESQPFSNQEIIEDDNSILSAEVSTPIILEEIVNSEIPDQIDEIFEELYDELAGTDELTEEPNLKSVAPRADKTISTQIDEDISIANINDLSFKEIPIELKDVEFINNEIIMGHRSTEPEEHKTLESESIETKKIMISQGDLGMVKTQICDSKTLLHHDSSEVLKDDQVIEPDISLNETHEVKKEILINKEEGNQKYLEYVLPLKDEPKINENLSPKLIEDNEINHDFNESNNNTDHENLSKQTSEHSKETIVVLKDNIDQYGNVYTPVLTVTKTEIVRTTPSSKHQKITVTEKHQDVQGIPMLEQLSYEKPNTVEAPLNAERKQDIDLRYQSSHGPELRTRNTSKDKMKEILDRSSDDFNQLDMPKRDYQIKREDIQKKTESSNDRSSKEFKPKIVHELTKQEVKDNESKIPKRKLITDFKTLNNSDENSHGSTPKGIDKSENDPAKIGLKGKVRNILKTMDKRSPKLNNTADDNIESLSTDSKKSNIQEMVEDEEMPTNINIDENLNDSNLTKETNSKKGIKGTVQNIIKNIVSINKPSREDNIKTENKHDVDSDSIQNLHIIDSDEIGSNDKGVEVQKKLSIKGKVQRVLKRFESKNNDGTTEDVINVIDSKIVGANAEEKPKNTKVKYIRKQFELKHQDIDDTSLNNEGQTILASRPYEKSDPSFLEDKYENERYFRPRYFKKEDELAMEASKGKVKNILRKIESKNISDDRKGVLSKGKSMEHLSKTSLDMRREFARRKSVSETVAMFESNTLIPIDFDSRHRKESANIREFAPISIPAAYNMSGNKDTVSSGQTTTDPNENKPTESELQAKLDALARAKEEFGTTVGPSLKLHSGDDMPAIAFGTGLLSSEAVGIIKAAIDLGYRHIDTAPVYGTEPQVGEAIRAKIDDGTVTREELFVTTKLWSTFHRRDLVEEACRNSLKSLGLEYLDLFIIHNPISMKEGAGYFPRRDGKLELSDSSDYMDAWLGMEDLVLKGLVRNIGVSNFNSEQITRVLKEGSIVPACNQVECHQYLNQNALDEFCSSRGIVLVGYGTLGSVGTPAQYITAGKPVLQDPLVKSIADKHGKTPAQVLIRYQLQRGRGVVVKSSSAPRLWGNLQAATFTLTEREMRALGELDADERHYKMEDFGVDNKNYPFNIPF